MNLETFLNGKSTETYFDEKILECKYLDEIPSELKNCNCCARHKNNFPTLGSALSTYNKNKKRVCFIKNKENIIEPNIKL